jgi:peptidoglycan/LPS O-acetylase OafA/YrhL
LWIITLKLIPIKKMQSGKCMTSTVNASMRNSAVTKNPELESLRGILAIAVLISHVELIEFYFGISYNYAHPVIFHLGRVAVTGFFVLSGYLISLSILNRIEQQQFSLRRFYTARAFRILPLYLFVVLIAAFALPRIEALQFTVPDFARDVRVETHFYWYFFLLMPQVPLLHDAILPFAEPTWSIGVEELFYLVIPFVFLYSGRRFPMLIVGGILGILIVRYTCIYYYKLPSSHMISIVLNLYRYDCIGLGCLLGILQFKKSKWFYSIKGVHVILSLAALILLFSMITLETYDYFPFALIFAVIIAYLSNHKRRYSSPRWLIYSGTVSYSLYLTHEIVVVFLIHSGIAKDSKALLYLLSISGALLLATVVYYLVERPFMKFGARRNNIVQKKTGTA